MEGSLNGETSRYAEGRQLTCKKPLGFNPPGTGGESVLRR
jgi:hypothetical protein